MKLGGPPRLVARVNSSTRDATAIAAGRPPRTWKEAYPLHRYFKPLPLLENGTL
jgi:hypothetical protein